MIMIMIEIFVPVSGFLHLFDTMGTEILLLDLGHNSKINNVVSDASNRKISLK